MESGERAALDWVSRLLEMFPDASLEGMMVTDAKVLSWALSGLDKNDRRIFTPTPWGSPSWRRGYNLSRRMRCAGRSTRSSGMLRRASMA